MTCRSAVLALCVVFAGCRGFWMGVANDDLAGEAAPPLTSTAWVGSPPTAEWRLLAFFKPG